MRLEGQLWGLRRPTRAHPLCGLWRGHFWTFGVRVLSLAYVFEGAAAQIMGTWVRQLSVCLDLEC